jgi:two-component system nitrogen regulation response regulator GlnG
MERSKKTILCVDDNKDNCDLLTFIFEQQGFDVTACESIEEGSIQIRKRKYSAVVLDNYFGDTTSLEVCKEFRWIDPHVPIIFYSGEARESEIEKAIAAGADAYLIKPNDFEKLVPTVIALTEEE